jgi:hypothetical protein
MSIFLVNGPNGRVGKSNGEREKAKEKEKEKELLCDCTLSH